MVFLIVVSCLPLATPAVCTQPSMFSRLSSDDITLYVGGNGPGNYTKIQDAIDNATEGDTVYVYSGFYAENIIIRTSLQLVGENRSSTVIDAGGKTTVVTIIASHVLMTGFTVQDSKNGTQYAGVDISTARNVSVTDNVLRDNGGIGILVRGPGTASIVISHNLIMDNSYGIYLYDSPQTYLAWNIITENGEGLYLIRSSLSTICNTTVENNKGLGLHLESSFGIYVSDNLLTNNKNGLYLFNSSSCVLSANTAQSNRWYGIWLKDSSGNTIEGNGIFGNDDLGLYLDTSDDNTIRNNTIFDNDNGIYYKDSTGNVVLRNSLRNNKYNAIYVAHALLEIRNSWRLNYWERPRVLPYPILGTLKIHNNSYPVMNFDWFPLRQVPQFGHKQKSLCDGNILYVGGSGPNNYSSIQSAIDDAQTNDTVFVWSGTYYEAVLIDKPLHLIGENKTTTILDGEGTRDIVTIRADYVDIKGFTLQNSHFDILVNHSSFGNISGNNIINGLRGVSVQNDCRFLTITHNTIQENVYGVRIYSSTDVTVSYNNFRSYKGNAFFFGTSLAHGRHHWYHNYWDKSRHLPYLIVGKIRFGNFSIVWVNCDWVPLHSPLEVFF